MLLTIVISYKCCIVSYDMKFGYVHLWLQLEQKAGIMLSPLIRWIYHISLPLPTCATYSYTPKQKIPSNVAPHIPNDGAMWSSLVIHEQYHNPVN